MLSRRDFISARFKSQNEEEKVKTESDIQKKICMEEIQSIATDFSEEMLCTEMMRIGKDPSNMNREEMLQTVLNLMRTQ